MLRGCICSHHQLIGTVTETISAPGPIRSARTWRPNEATIATACTASISSCPNNQAHNNYIGQGGGGGTVFRPLSLITLLGGNKRIYLQMVTTMQPRDESIWRAAG